jgi:hypothetical protein
MMKLHSVLFAALVLASFFDALPAESKTKDGARLPAAQLANFQPGKAANGSTHKSAMAECEAQYGGQRFFLGRERYAYIEQCFRQSTGMYPHQVQMNCSIARC